MAFRNESTYLRMRIAGREEEFHKHYEESLLRIGKELGKKHPLYIGAEKIYTENSFEVKSPSDRRIVIGKFSAAGREDVRDAIETAQHSFAKWARTDYRKRIEIVRRAADIASSRKYDLAAAMSMENGKNRLEAMADVDEAIDFMRYYSEQVALNGGFAVSMGSSGPGESNESILRPYGVWGVIAPFNFPLAIACGMSTGALVMGNTVVLKPSSFTPYMSLLLHDIYKDAGLPPGVLNVVTGGGAVTGRELVENENVAGIAFTGSREVGLSSMHRFTEGAFKPFIAELGGKNIVVITKRADLKKAVEGTARAAFGYGGQKCSAASRVVVVGDIKDEFLKKLASFTEGLRVGNPTLKQTYMGPLISEEAVKKYEEAIGEARETGKVATGGKVLKEGELSYGNYVSPAIVSDVPFDSRIFREELFVPLLCVVEMDTLDDAIEIANSVDYGLTAGIFSEDKEEISTFFDNIEAGVCYANKAAGATTGAMVGGQPFVGWKMSGSTGKGAGGIYYLQQFAREQSRAVFE
ncbi:MAG: aldehyde dehydrogenase family protein [Methanomassiliicoccales archaeon]